MNIELVVPLIHTDIGLENLVNDSLLNEKNDQSVEVVFEKELFRYAVDELIHVPEIQFEKLFTVDSLRLANTNIDYDITLGQIFRGIGGLEGFIMLAQHGKNAQIDTIENMSTETITIDAGEYFESAELLEGTMYVTIQNNLPVDIENVAYQFRNGSTQKIIAIDTVALIRSGETSIDSFDLANESLEDQLEVELTNFDSPGSRGEEVLIDTTDNVSIGIQLKNIQVYEATAVFPAQYLINDHNDVDISEEITQELTEMTIKTGIFATEIANTAQDTVYVFFNFPGVTKNGVPLSSNMKLPPPIPGEVYRARGEIDLAGYHFDLTGRWGDSTNTFFSTFTARIDSTGEIVTLTKADSFKMYLGFENLTAASARGYMGNDTIETGLNITDFDVFNNFTDGNIQFDALDVELEIENSMGFEGGLEVKHLEGRGLNNSVTLTSTATDDMLIIPAATESPLTTTYSSIELNKNNSNIVELINTNPRSLAHEVKLHLNPSRNVTENFVLDSSKVVGNLKLSLPLSFISNNLTLIDTVDFNVGAVNNIDKVERAILRVVAKNDFPLEARLKINLLDEEQNFLHAVNIENKLEAGIVSKNGTSTATASHIDLIFSEREMDYLRDSKHLELTVSFDSKPNNEMVTIYSSYGMELNIVGDFKYKNK